MRIVGLAATFLALILVLSSFLPVPEYPVVMPMPVVESRPDPQPYNLPLEYASALIYDCDKYEVPVWLASRLFMWESGWNANYYGRANLNGTHDLGLAALNSAYLVAFRQYNGGAVVDPFDPGTAMRVGVRYLAALHAETGSWVGAVAAYNIGLGAWQAGVRPVAHIKGVLGE